MEAQGKFNGTCRLQECGLACKVAVVHVCTVELANLQLEAEVLEKWCASGFSSPGCGGWLNSGRRRQESQDEGVGGDQAPLAPRHSASRWLSPVGAVRLSGSPIIAVLYYFYDSEG